MMKFTTHSVAPAAMFFVFAAARPCAAADAPIESLSFQQCFDLAVKQSETLLQTQENIEQSKARRRVAIGSVLPYVQWGMTTTIQDTSGSREGGGVGGTLTRKERTQSQFTARQPIFQGFKELYSVAGSKAERRRDEARLMDETVNLYMEVAQAFYRVLQLETLGADLREQLELTEDRDKDLRGRVRLGKSRSSEVLSSESQLATLKSQEAANQGNIITARENLGFLIGRDARYVRLVDTLAAPVLTAGGEDVVKRLSLNRSDIRAQREEMEARRYGIRVAQADYYPGASVTGNYYTHRPGFQSEIDWDVVFTLDVPIFQGGGVKALSDEARSRYRQAQFELNRLMRWAESEIRQVQATLDSSIREAELLKDAQQKSLRSYRSLAEEYRLGLVNNLDVLQAMNIMLNAKASYHTAVLQSKLNSLKLKAVTEELP